MLEHHHIRPPGRKKFETAGIGGIHETPLTFQKHHIGTYFLPGTPYRMLDLAGYEIIHQGIQNNPVPNTLHPGGLARSDEFSAISRRLQGIGQNPGRGALSNGGIGSQNCDTQAGDIFDLSAEKVKILSLRGFSNIPEPYPRFFRQPFHFIIFRKKIMQARIDI